ncbi:FAD-dependent monooxygenase [Oxalobacteraceae bacterium]|nr:FAD-dependent monooxygenase [Oxalobacteraceae bacterium]
MPAASHGVLIAGAGPTGLTLANALAAYGVPFQIIDQKPGPSSDSKGLALNIASQYGLELLGLGDMLGQAGCRVRRLNVLWQGRRLNPIDFRRLDFPLRSFITQPQATTEAELVAALARQGHAVRWNTRLLEVGQHGEAATASIALPDGSRQQRGYAWVVGCEGKHSLVRESMGAVMNGGDHPMYFALGDFALNYDGPQDEVSYHVHDDGFFILVPIGAGVWRVVVKHDGPVPAQPLQAEEITATVKRHLGEALFGAAPVWMSRAAFYTRTSDRLRQRRLFLAGDAAHLFVPIGGTGMNTGMQDALNLAWKLAHCWHGQAADTLLDTYEHERLAAIRGTASVTDLSLRMIARVERNPAALAELMPSMANRPALRQLPLRHSGLALSYAGSQRWDGGSARPGNRGAGQFCIGLARLYRLLDGAGAPAAAAQVSGQVAAQVPAQLPAQARTGAAVTSAALLAVVRFDAAPDSAGMATLILLQRLRHAYPQALRVLVLLADAGIASLLPSLPVAVHAADAQTLQLSGLAGAGLLLVQPDGVIAYSGGSADGAGLQAVLETHFLAGAAALPAQSHKEAA